MLNNLIYTHTLNTVAASGNCEKAIRDLVSSGGFIDLFVDVANKGFAGGVAELFKTFFDALLGPLAAVARPLFAALLEKLGGRGAVNSFTQKLLEFAQKAKAAARPQCLNQYDEVWNEVADMAGIKDAKTLKEIVERLSGKLEEEIRSRVKKLVKSLRSVENQVRAISISPDATYFYAKDWLGGKDEDGRLKLCNVFMGDCDRDIYVEYVPNELEKKVVEKVRKRAEEGGGLLIVKGAKGIGKSTAVEVALYRVLQLPLKVGDRYYKPVVVVVKEYSKDKAKRFIRAAKRRGFYPIFYLDPSKTGDYPKEPSDFYQPDMPIGELHLVLDKLRDVTGAVAVVVLSNDQHQAVEGLVSKAEVIDADQLLALEKEKYVEALVKSYSNCTDDMVKKVAGAVASFNDNYAVAAVVAAYWLKRGECRGEEVERAVKEAEGNVHRFILHYLWYGLFNGKDGVARQYASLLLAVGFFGPHPPKLAKAVVEAFGGEPEGVIVQWFSQRLHSTIFDAIKNFVNCVDQSRGGITLCEDYIAKLLINSIPRELRELKKNGEEEVAKRLKQKVIKATARLSSLVEDFKGAVGGLQLKPFDRWVLKSQALGVADMPVEDTYDQLDVLLAVLGIAALRVIPRFLERFVREWVVVGGQFITVYKEWAIVGGEPAQALSEYVKAVLYADREALHSKVVEVFYKVRNRGYLTQMDVWEIVGLLRAVDWENASDEEVKYALRLSHYLLREHKFVPPEVVKPSLQRLFKSALGRLDGVASELAFLYRRHSIEGLDPWALYDKVNDLEKVFILQGLLRQRAIGRFDHDKVEERVKELEKELKNDDITLLLRLTVYPRLAVPYAEVGERVNAVRYIDMSLEALSCVGPSIAKLRRLLSPYYSPYEFSLWTAELPLYVYINAALAYMALGEVQRGLEIVEKVWNLISTLAPNEHVATKALEAYLIALAYQKDEKFHDVVDKYSEAVGRISDTTYNVLKVLGANIQKIDKMRRINTPPTTLFDHVFADIALTLVIAIRSTITRSLQSEDDRLALAKFYYDTFLNGLLYV